MSLQKGSEGPAVCNLQNNLNQICALSLDCDGLFGPKTMAAVVQFQIGHGIIENGIVDEETQSAITKSLIGQISMPADGPSPWLAWMRGHIGEIEITGSKATPFNDEVFSHTNYGHLNGIMVAGCAATACAALEESGFKSPHNAAAESFRNFGVTCELKPGALVGFNWSGKKGAHADHITFLDHIVNDKTVACLGGNQGHEVKVSLFSRSYIDFIRWPLEKMIVPNKIEPIKIKVQG